MSRIWITGYRSYELSIFNESDPKIEVIKESLKNQLIAKIEAGVDWIITGPQLGVEQWGAEIALELKDRYPEIKVAVMLPFAKFGSQWNEANQLKLQTLTSRVDFSDQISDQSYQSPLQLKNFQKFMLTHTDEALFIYDPEHEGKAQYDYDTVQLFANHHPYPITIVDFEMLQETANEISEKKRLENDEDY